MPQKRQPPDHPAFGPRITELRKAAGLSLRAFAREIGISHRMLVYYETQATKPPFDLLPKMAKALGVSVRDLIEK